MILKHFHFKCFRRFFKVKYFLFFKIDLRNLKTSFKKLTTCSTDLLLFFIDIEIIKANENHINISHEKYKYIDSCFEASNGELNEINNSNL